MKITMAQMSMSSDIEENFSKTIKYINMAKDDDFIFFPEIQMTPFFPQYEKKDKNLYCMNTEDEKIKEICEKAYKYNLYISPNIYIENDDKYFDASLWITPEGRIEDTAKMVHIIQAERFYEQDYYTASDDGFKVFDTKFGRIGIVICFDRHLPESIRTCAVMGADLIIIPTANTKDEPMEMFEWELRVQAMQNNVFIAMCNRTGREDMMDFSGESIVVDPNGDVVIKADDKEQLINVEINLEDSKRIRKNRPYITTRRTEWYK